MHFITPSWTRGPEVKVTFWSSVTCQWWVCSVEFCQLVDTEWSRAVRTQRTVHGKPGSKTGCHPLYKGEVLIHLEKLQNIFEINTFLGKVKMIINLYQLSNRISVQHGKLWNFQLWIRMQQKRALPHCFENVFSLSLFLAMWPRETDHREQIPTAGVITGANEGYPVYTSIPYQQIYCSEMSFHLLI